MELVETIELTKDTIGEMFMTRGGKVVQMVGWNIEGGNYPAKFSVRSLTREGKVRHYSKSLGDLKKYLPRSKYPEYYL